MTSTITKLTNILFISFFLISSFYSIKLSKNKAIAQAQANSQGIVRGTINGIRRVDREIHDRDERIFNDLLDEKIKADREKDRYFNRFERVANADNLDKYNFSNIAKESFKDLHSGKLRAANFVNNINNEFRERDANYFNDIVDLKTRANVNKAKFLNKLNRGVEEDNLRKFDLPRTIKESERALTAIHFINRNNNSSFIETHANETNVNNQNYASPTQSLIGQMINNGRRIIKQFKHRNQELREEVLDPKINQFKKEVQIAKNIQNIHDQKQGKLEKSFTKVQIHTPHKDPNYSPPSQLSEMITNAKTIIKNVKNINQELNQNVIIPKEQKWRQELAAGKQIQDQFDTEQAQLLKDNTEVRGSALK